jgi:hypothetical protein
MTLWIGLAAAAPAWPALGEDLPVDLELVLAIDTSQSVDTSEGRLQRDGYVRALRDAEVIGAILSAPYGRVAVTYVEWAGPDQMRVVMDWQLVDSRESALAVATQLRRSPIAGGQGTSISGAIFNAMPLFDGNGYEGMRRVIDVSGDGPNSSGANVTVARDAAVEAGIIVNGAAINNFDGSPYTLPDLDVYYRECVVGGPGSFVVAVDGFQSFAEAIRRKLVLEVAGLEPRVVPVASDGVVPAQSRQKYAPECDIGERMRAFGFP